jgi:hypothetical protein
MPNEFPIRNIAILSLKSTNNQTATDLKLGCDRPEDDANDEVHEFANFALDTTSSKHMSIVTPKSSLVAMLRTISASPANIAAMERKSTRNTFQHLTV